MDADVVVVGAGPVGLLLAAELELAGAQALVVERLAEPSREPRARGVGPLAAEALQRRGLGARLDAFHPRGRADRARDHGSEKGHFGWIHKIDQEMQDEPHRTGVLIAQPDLERVLAEHLDRLGGKALRAHQVTALEEDGDGVTVVCGAPGGELRLRAAYVVGCDGGRSTVRKLAGFPFPGTGPLMTARRADADVLCPAGLPPVGRTPTGTLFHAPGAVGTFDFEEAEVDPRSPVTTRELEASLCRVAGTEVTVTALRGATRFTDQARLVPSYRLGRVLLAGDAAHVHSPNGGQGLTLGLLDAANLGWKLAAAVDGRPGLLDSYTAERRPAAEAVLHNTRAQSALMRPGPHTDALRDIVAELMDLPDVNRYFGRMLNGLGTRYPLPEAGPDAHPAVGTHCPDLVLTAPRTGGADRAAGASLYALTERGGSVLVHTDGAGLPPTAVEREGTDRESPDRESAVTVVRVGAIGGGELSAVLLRPDGVVAWAAAAGAPADPAGLDRALRTWCAPV
ncbi:2-polyprenyl-6-methoxyphenol hydroxylase [Actinacidiphila yanglinensis]|uniref:2-polyprenyl-6-methoxyphenol hydroxylase n=1 Tax=Actinacidiphila yanglinensis TaxID=310779 RepID=A0A1H6E934_9ACTN|nr:FAD-dependent monooxygenase [Actinacidiphila yanglinensis]SEG93629.1 2-polyprenyl-6-methoxyphenol hydroxylase [Actinacidiphila yanglinensis]